MIETAYVTLAEAAELEGISYETLRKRCYRGSLETKNVPQASGGKPLVMAAVNSLSKRAQNAKAERDRLMEIASQPVSEEKQVEEEKERPWYVDMDMEWFRHQYNKRYYEAAEMGNVIRKFLQESNSYKGNLTAFTNRFAEEHTGKSGRTFYRMVEAYQEAENWAAVLEKQDG